MSLPKQKYPNTSRVILGSSNIVRQDDVTLLCNTSSGVVALTLQDIPDNYWSSQYKLYVVDLSGNAGTNNITINAPSGQTINGASSFVINTNSASVVLTIVANGKYICQYSVVGGGVSQAYQTIQNEGTPLTQRSIINFTGSSINATDDAGNSRTNVAVQAYNTIYNSGVALEQQDDINFYGSSIDSFNDPNNAITKSNVSNKSFTATVIFGGSPGYDGPSSIINSVPDSPNGGIPENGQVMLEYSIIHTDIYVKFVEVVSSSAPAVYDITFSSNHNLATNTAQTIQLFGILGATTANGTFTYSATPPSTNRFQIINATKIRIQVAGAAGTYLCGGQMLVVANNSIGNYAISPDCSFGTFDSATGLFSITQDGLYLLQATIHLKPDDSSTIYWSTTDNGLFGLAMTDNTSVNIYSGVFQTVLQNKTTQIDLTCTCPLVVTGNKDTPANPAEVRVKVLNNTTRNYNATAYTNRDGVRLSITKLS